LAIHRGARVTSAPRLVALDAFRGAVIAFMVLVNTPGTGDAVYAPLRHAAWHGWTPTDAVFPSFVWITGVAMTLSLGKRLREGVSRQTLLLQALRRAAILFALGWWIYSFPLPDWPTCRMLGVLQRIAICYFVSAAVYLYAGLRGVRIAALACLLGYWALMAWAPVPGYGAGHWDVERNFAHYVDRVVLGAHNYEHTRTWDPEGVVSTIPAIASCLLGVLAGAWLTQLPRLAWGGVALLAVGLAWSVWMPINKMLWTGSYVLCMAGMDMVLLAAFLWVIDVRGYTRWCRPFVMLGMNAIAVYMASELIDVSLWKLGWRMPLYHAVFAPWAAPANASLIYALTYVALMFALAYGMYRRRWFVRV